MAFSSFTRGMSEFNEKHLSSIAKFIPTASNFGRAVSRSSESTCADTPTAEGHNGLSDKLCSPQEETLAEQLEFCLGKESMSPEELGLLYSYRHGVSFDDELKALGHADSRLRTFLQNHKKFSFQGDCVKLPDLAGSEPLGDDISTTFVDFDDFASAASDDESSDSHNAKPACSINAAACTYSVMMLLQFRAICDHDEDASTSADHCSAQLMSDMPTPVSPKAKSPAKARTALSAVAMGAPWRTNSDSTGESGRMSPADMTDSWRQMLPAVAADSWVAQQRDTVRSSASEDENVTRAARLILNKLTVEKFESLFEQLATCGFKHPHHISILMREVFEKATTQHHFIPMYADLCVQLEKDPRIAAVVEDADQLHNFRRILLNQCQSVFEQLLEPPSGESDTDQESIFCRKQQALGNMKLIGQLLVLGMLSSDLFPECCEELLRRRTQCAEALESLVALMMVAGPKFDSSSWQYYQRLEKILLDMRDLTKDKLVPPRLRFLIRDVLDARAAGWPSSRGMAAMKLEEVRIAAEASPVRCESPKCDSKESIRAKMAESLKKCAESLEEKSNPVKACKKKPAAKDTAQTPAAAPAPEQAFDVVAFRRTLASIFSDLASDKNIPAAVQRIRLEQVPSEKQAEQFVDILTRIVEERRGAVRRCELAFITGLAAADPPAFERKECVAGVGLFFKEVYPDLCDEVHRLPAIMKSEFMPTILNVLPAAELNKVVPAAMRK